MTHVHNRHHRSGKFNSQYSRNKPLKVKFGEKGREVIEKIDESNPVIQQFQSYAKELDEKHDRFERIVKHSRDITIESKRVIFSLHTIDSEIKKDTTLQDVNSKFNKICERYFRPIASELDRRDFYRYLRAYRGGLQEFVEAYTFYWYLKNDTLPHWKELQKILTFVIENLKDDKVETTNENVTEESKDNMIVKPKMIEAYVDPNEFILGLCDLTGELMRKCVNSLSTGNLSICYKTCAFVRDMYKEFLGCCGKSEKDINRKVVVLRRSVLKMENVCYTIKVRGSEIPQHMLAGVIDEPEEYAIIEDDEGYNAY